MGKDSGSEGIACLLVHGLNGSPYDFNDLAVHLHERGIITENILLPGHDIHHRDAALYGWRDWLKAVKDGFERLTRTHKHVVIVGHSMGASLALAVAAHDVRVAGIVSLCAPAELHAGLLPIVGVGRHIVHYLPVIREDISDRMERRAYRRRKVTHWAPIAPMHTLLQALPLLRADLSQISCPTLVVAARRDHVVPMRDGQYVYEHISSFDKELLILDRSWHVVMRDVERIIVTDHITGFLDRLQPTITLL